MAGEKERRFSKVKIQTRELSDGTMKVRGLAIPYGKLVDTGWDFLEKIREGAATEALKTKNQYMFYQHSSDRLLASIQSDSLTLEERADGVYFEASLVNTSLGRDVYEEVKTGLLNGVSCGFFIGKESWEKTEDGVDTREIISFDELLEISLVTYPAYTTTTVEARKRAERNKPNNKPEIKNEETEDVQTQDEPTPDSTEPATRDNDQALDVDFAEAQLKIKEQEFIRWN